jgi:hypothetical protein
MTKSLSQDTLVTLVGKRDIRPIRGEHGEQAIYSMTGLFLLLETV